MDNTYMDLAARLEDSFPDVENEVIMDMRENNEDYAALRGEISDIENKHNFIGRVLNGSGEVHLTEEEHKLSMIALLTCFFLLYPLRVKISNVRPSISVLYGYRPL